MDLKIPRLFVVIFIEVIIRWVNTYSYYCDVTNTRTIREGNLGQSNVFAWLGVLRVILWNSDNDDKIPDIAVTGVVLVKEKYALVNAHDVSRIPLFMLKANGRVQFFPTTDVSWSCKPKSYTVHPEYGPITYNTVALLELDLLSSKDEYILKPICWTSQPLNASTYLYAAGYTDENKLLEKMLYKLQYTDNSSCSEFYNRAKLGEKSREPLYYICGHAPSSRSQCVWDNGMVLISNATQYFTLLGFGVRGPGCAAPARFINLQYYYEWMQEVTTERDQYDEYRRDGGFEEVPLHELFKTQLKSRHDEKSRRSSAKKSIPMKNYYYPFDTDSPLYFNVEEADNDSIAVFPFNNTWESFDKACNSWRSLMYREYFELNANGRIGNAVYKVSLYDLLINKCTCIKIDVNVDAHSSAILSIKEQIDLMEGEAISSSEEMIPNLFKRYPFHELYPSPPNNPGQWEPGPNLQPSYLKEFFDPKNVTNYNLYLKFEIKDKAVLKIEMYGEPYGPGGSDTTPNKMNLLRFNADKETTDFKPRHHIHQTQPILKSEFIEKLADSKSNSLYGVLKRKHKITTTVKTTTASESDPLTEKVYNFSRPKVRPVVFRKTIPSTTETAIKLLPTRQRVQHKYDKVQLQTRAYTISTPYPTAHVEPLSITAGSPRNVFVFRVTLAKVLCFDIVMLLINS